MDVLSHKFIPAGKWNHYNTRHRVKPKGLVYWRVRIEDKHGDSIQIDMVPGDELQSLLNKFGKYGLSIYYEKVK